MTQDGVWLHWDIPTEYKCPWQSFGPFGLLMAQHILLQCMGRERLPELQPSIQAIRDNLFAMFEVVLDFPAHTLDWLESTNWNTSSFDIAVTLRGSQPDYQDLMSGSFREHVRRVPVPKPFLPSWSEDLDPALGLASQEFARARARGIVQRRFQEG